MFAADRKPTKKAGDIGDSFVSLSGAASLPLPDRFRQLKCDLVKGNEAKIVSSWSRLLERLEFENNLIAEKKHHIIPQVSFENLENDCEDLKEEIHKRGAVVVRGVIPENEALAYQGEIEEYVRKNPTTRGATLF